MEGSREHAQPQKPALLPLVGQGIGGIVGFAVGSYAGFALLIPLGFALLVGWVLSKIVPARNKPIVAASALQAGHGLWMLLGMVVLSQFDLTLIEALILVVGTVCLAYWPSVVLVVLLVCYQAVGLAVNGLAFAQATVGTEIHKALLVHLVLRATAIVLMVYGLVEVGRQKRRAAQPSDFEGAVDDVIDEGAIAETHTAPDRGGL